MLRLAILFTFTLALIIANIVCFKKKTYPYLFFPCMLFLPNYYGFEISESVPLITVTRIMYLIFYIYVFLNYRQNLDCSHIKSLFYRENKAEGLTSKASLLYFMKTQPAVCFLAGYFILRIISNLHYITTYGTAAKTIFEIVFEQLLLCIAAYLIRFSKEEIDKLIRIIVYAATVMFVLGIFESYTGIRFTDALYTVQRIMLNDHYIRLGLMRATVTMGLPGFYGNMCVIMIPFILYLFNQKNEKKFLVIILLDMLAIIHSGCRSDIIFFMAVIGIYYIMNLKNKAFRLHFFKNACALLVALFCFTGILSLVNERCNYYYIGTAKSVLNEVGFDFDLDEGAPEGVDGYGVNDVDGSVSRLAELTGIKYVLNQSPIWGLGSGAQTRGDIRYYYDNKWRKWHSYDVGYVEIFMDEGLIGILGFSCFFLSLLSSHIILISKGNKFGMKYLSFNILAVLTYLICLFSTANIFKLLMLIYLMNRFQKVN